MDRNWNSIEWAFGVFATFLLAALCVSEFGWGWGILITVILMTGIPLVWVFRIYIQQAFAKNDFVWTLVNEPTVKMVVRAGALRDIVITKQGYKIARAEDVANSPRDPATGKPTISLWDIIPCLPQECPTTGIRFIGWPWLDTVYQYDCKFVKAEPDGTFTPRNDRRDYLLADVPYQYGLEFGEKDLPEDKNGFRIVRVKLVLTASIHNPKKALLDVRSWYDAMVSRILPYVRLCISLRSYEDLRGDLDKCLWEEITKPRDEMNCMSILQVLSEMYGIKVHALEVINIDPPPEFIEAATQVEVAGREAEAAKAVASKEAEIGSRILRTVANRCGISVDELRKALKDDPKLRGKPESEGGFKEAFSYAEDQAKRDRAGNNLHDIRMGNSDGTNLEPMTATVATLINLWRGGADMPNSPSDSGGQKKDQKSSQPRKKGGGNKSGGKTIDDADDDIIVG